MVNHEGLLLKFGNTEDSIVKTPQPLFKTSSAVTTTMEPPARVVRQESFKRSRPYMDNEQEEQNISPRTKTTVVITDRSFSSALGENHEPEEFHDCITGSPSLTKPGNDVSSQQPELVMICERIEGLNVNRQLKKFSGQGIKRTASEAISNIIVETPLEQQEKIARKVAAYLIEKYQGSEIADSVFVGKQLRISFAKYVDRLMRFTNKWSEEKDGVDSFGVRCGIVAVEYLERTNLALNDKNIHRCYLMAVLVSIKLLYDFYISNQYWGEVGGCTLKEINAMEFAFCDALKWSFNISEASHAKRVEAFVSD
jgi:hypothetical protein